MVKWMDQLARALAGNEFEVEQIAAFEASSQGWQGPYGLRTLGDRWKSPGWGGHYLRGLRRFFRVRKLVRDRLERNWKPHLVLTDSTPSLMLLASSLGRKCRAPHTVIVGGDFFKESRHSLLRRFVKGLYIRADRIVVDGEDLRQLMLQVGVLDEKVRLLPHGIDTDVLRPDVPVEPFHEFLKGKGIEPPVSGPVILSHGTLKDSTGCEDFVALLERMEVSTGVLIGSGPLEDRIRDEAGQMKGRLIMTGFLPEEILPSALAVADVCVYPFRQMAGVSLAVVEAMSCGKAVVVTECGDLRKVVRDGETGLVVPIGDLDGLARSVRSLLDDEALRERMGIGARTEVEDNWSLGKRQRDFLELVSEVL